MWQRGGVATRRRNNNQVEFAFRIFSALMPFKCPSETNGFFMLFCIILGFVWSARVSSVWLYHSTSNMGTCWQQKLFVLFCLLFLIFFCFVLCWIDGLSWRLTVFCNMLLSIFYYVVIPSLPPARRAQKTLVFAGDHSTASRIQFFILLEHGSNSITRLEMN